MPPHPALPSRMLRAWRTTTYTVDGIALRIGRRSTRLDALLRALGARQATLITAWNVFGQRMPDGWNRRMQCRLTQRLRRFPIRSADGRLGNWHEAHLLVAANARPLRRLGRVFRQGGLVELRVGQAARLRVLV